MRERQHILLLALLIDAVWGDPPSRYHPVAWMGQGIAWLSHHAPPQSDGRRLAFGALISPGGAVLAGGMGALGHQRLRRFPGPVRMLAEAVVLKSTFAWRGLDQAAAAVETALRHGDLEAARRHLSWHLVSRPTALLTPAEVAAATVESLAENTSDGIIAPLVAYLLGGLPAALAYRYVNTADAMLGYHDPVHEWLGKVPARTDDLLNLLPARLTAALLVLVAPWCGADAAHVWQIWWRDRHLTLSPNAGHPMSAMAGALHVELTKIGHYTLGRGEGVATPETIRQARRIVRGIVGMVFMGLILISPPHTEEPHA